MTERGGRGPRWAATILAAPGAAAVFGAATAWSLHTAPATQVKQPSTGSATAPAARTDPAAAVPALQRSAAANKAQVARLNQLVAELRAQLKVLTTSPYGTTSGATPGVAGGPATAAGPAITAPVQTPAAAAPSSPPGPPSAPAAVPSPTPPPPAHTSTGASG
jgi:hypothetical protein